MISIYDIAYYVPSNKQNLVDCYDQIGISKIQAKIFERIYQLQSIPIASENSNQDLIAKAVEQLIVKWPEMIKRVKLIIYAHTSSLTTTFGQSVARRIQHQYQFQNALAFSTTLNKCVASIRALQIAEQFLHSCDRNSLVLITSGEICYSSAVRCIKNTSIAGDASVALLVGKSRICPSLISARIVTNSKFARGMWMSNDELCKYDEQYVEQLASIILTSLNQTALSINDIDLVLPHNINYPSWYKVAEYLKIPIKKIYLNNIKKIAHTLGADIFINLYDAINQQMIKKGNKSLMVSVGLGASYGCVLLQH